MPRTLSQLPENEIIDLVLEGNERAFGELYKRYLDEIYRYLYYRVSRDQNEAEDLTQEVFIRAWDAISENKIKANKRNFRALLYRIATNLSVDRWRKKKYESNFQQGNHEMEALGYSTPEQALLTQERSQELAAAIRELDPQLQNVFICRFINRLSHAETARSLGLNEGHVRVLQHRALKKIRIVIE